MTRQRTLLLVAGILLVAGSAIFFLVQRKQAVDPLHFLPGDTLAMLDVRQPAAFIAEFRKSPLGQRFDALRWRDLLAEFGVSADQAADFQTGIDTVQNFLDGPLPGELFGNRAVLALLPPLARGTASRTDTGRLEDLVLIVSPRHRIDALELLTPLLPNTGQLPKESYRGVEIRTLVLANDVSLSLAADEGLFLASFSAATLKRCLDLALNAPEEERPRLNTLSAYLDLRQRAAGQDRLYFYTAIPDSWLPAVPDNSPSGQIRHGVLFCGNNADVLRCTAVLLPGPGTEPPLPAADETLSALPADVILHSWTNLFAPPEFIAALLQLPFLPEAITDGDAWLRGRTGLDLTEFFSLFGSRIGCTVTGMRHNDFFPLPRLWCRVAVRDEERLRSAISSVLAGRNLTRRAASGVGIHGVMLAGGLLQPSYAFKDGDLYFADSPEQIEQCLAQPAAPLTASDQFRQVDVGLLEPGHMNGYISYPRLADGLRRLAAWCATILALTDQERGKRAGFLVDQALLPMLDGLRMFAAASFRLQVAPAEVVLESALVRAEREKED